MALSNRDRVGKALELLAGAFGPYIDRRMTKRSPMGGNWKAAYADVNVEEDPSAQINVCSTTGKRYSATSCGRRAATWLAKPAIGATSGLTTSLFRKTMPTGRWTPSSDSSR